MRNCPGVAGLGRLGWLGLVASRPGTTSHGATLAGEVWRCEVRPGGTRTGEAGKSMRGWVLPVMASLGGSRFGGQRRGRHGLGRQGKAQVARRGLERQGLDWLVELGIGKAGMVVPDVACHREARNGSARQGLSAQGRWGETSSCWSWSGQLWRGRRVLARYSGPRRVLSRLCATWKGEARNGRRCLLRRALARQGLESRCVVWLCRLVRVGLVSARLGKSRPAGAGESMRGMFPRCMSCYGVAGASRCGIERPGVAGLDLARRGRHVDV